MGSKQAETAGVKTEGAKQATGLTAAHIIFGILASLIATGIFVFVWDHVKDQGRDTTAFDRVILFWMHRHTIPWVTTVARGLAWMGSPPTIVTLAVLAALLGLFWRRIRGAAWTLPIAVLGAGVIIQGVKMEFRRPRPHFFTPLLKETGYSFPSGHSLIAVVVYGLLGYFVLSLVRKRGRAARRGVITLTVLLIIAIGVSRVYVGVHYPTDVLAGWTAGIPWLLTCIGLHEVMARHFAAAGHPVLPQSPNNPIENAVLGKERAPKT